MNVSCCHGDQPPYPRYAFMLNTDFGNGRPVSISTARPLSLISCNCRSHDQRYVKMLTLTLLVNANIIVYLMAYIFH